jgi:disulfide bond formation protein DsbB
METGFQHLHSLLRWMLLILMLISVSKALLSAGRRFFGKDRKMALFIMIIAHVQLILGLGLYFMKNYHLNWSDIGELSSYLRFFTMEHLMGMIIAIVLITLGYGKVKRAETDALKFKAVKVYFGIALIIILVSIPWPFREGFEALGWF